MPLFVAVPTRNRFFDRGAGKDGGKLLVDLIPPVEQFANALCIKFHRKPPFERLPIIHRRRGSSPSGMERYVLPWGVWRDACRSKSFPLMFSGCRRSVKPDQRLIFIASTSETKCSCAENICFILLSTVASLASVPNALSVSPHVIE